MKGMNPPELRKKKAEKCQRRGLVLDRTSPLGLPQRLDQKSYQNFRAVFFSFVLLQCFFVLGLILSDTEEISHGQIKKKKNSTAPQAHPKKKKKNQLENSFWSGHWPQISQLETPVELSFEKCDFTFKFYFLK